MIRNYRQLRLIMRWTSFAVTALCLLHGSARSDETSTNPAPSGSAVTAEVSVLEPPVGADPWMIPLKFGKDQLKPIRELWQVVLIAEDGKTVVPQDRIDVQPASLNEKQRFNLKIKPDGQPTLAAGRYNFVLVPQATGGKPFAQTVSVGASTPVSPKRKSKGRTFAAESRSPRAAVAETAVDQGIPNLKLKEWIVNRAGQWKVKGVARHDHQPIATCERLQKIFSDLAVEADQSPITPGSNDAVIDQLEAKLRSDLDSLYDERYGVRRDWEPFLKEIRVHATEIADESATRPGLIGTNPLVLSNPKHVAVVLGEVAEGFKALKEYHSKNEDELSGAYQGGASTPATSTTGQNTEAGRSDDDCRCRRRRCRTCWSLLLGS